MHIYKRAKEREREREREGGRERERESQCKVWGVRGASRMTS